MRPRRSMVRVFLLCVSARVPYTVVAWLDPSDNIRGAKTARARRCS